MCENLILVRKLLNKVGDQKDAQSTQTDSSLLESNCVVRGNEAARNGYIEQRASRRGDSDFGRPVCHDGLENVIQGDGSSSEQD